MTTDNTIFVLHMTAIHRTVLLDALDDYLDVDSEAEWAEMDENGLMTAAVEIRKRIEGLGQ